MDRYILIDPTNGLAGADDDRRREEFELFDPDEPTGDVRILRGRPLRGVRVDPAQNEPRDRDAEGDVSNGSHVRKTEEIAVLIPGDCPESLAGILPSQQRRGGVMLRCRDIVELLDDYLDGALDRAYATALDAHLADCWDCMAFFKTYRGVVRASRRLRDAALPAPLSGC